MTHPRSSAILLGLAVALGGLAGVSPSGADEPAALPNPAAAAATHPIITADGYPPAPTAAKSEGISPDGIEVAGWGSGAPRVASDPSAWGGERPSFGMDGKPLSDRIASYDLTATLDPDKHTVEGKERLHWKNRSDRPVASLYFHLYLNAFDGEGSTFMTEKAHYGAFRSNVETKKGEWGWIDLTSVSSGGKPATFVFVHPDAGPETDRSVVRIDLPEPIAPGATGELELEFHDQLPRVVARTGYFMQYHLVAQWFPKVGVLELAGERGATAPRWNCHEFHLNSEFYADFGDYRAELTAPKGYLVRATGVEQGAPKEAPTGLTHTFAQDDVHDFVWTAWNGYAEPLHGAYDGPGSPHVDVEVLSSPEYAKGARDALEGTVDALRYFSETLGPYPYPHVTVVVVPFNAAESGGMEYETFFTTDTGHGLMGSLTRYITVHEFGHGYFMGLLASNEFEEPFLDEGMNEFWDTRMLAAEHLTFPLPIFYDRLGIKIPPIAYADFERLRGTQRFQADPIAGNSWDRYSEGSYGLVYPRTVMVMDDLEKRLGKDGLARGMKLYYRRWHHRHPSTADLRDALAEGSGEAAIVDDWFDHEVYTNEPVDDSVTTVAAREIAPLTGTRVVDGKRVEIDSEEVNKEIEEAHKAWRASHPDAKHGGPYPFRSEVIVRRNGGHVSQKLVVTFDDDSTETVAFPAPERWHRYVFERAAEVTSAQLDPDREILLDLNKLDDGRTREPHASASARWSIELSSAAELLLSMVASL